MKVKCIIVDDEPIAIRVIQNHLQNFENIEVLAECKNSIQALEILKKKKVDLMFLDIQMPQITGIDFLKTLTHPPKVIITTAYRDYAIEGYELEVLDYLLKPISFERFLKAINKYYQIPDNEGVVINSSLGFQKNQFIYIKENKKIHKIYLSEIDYLESMKEYVKIHTSNGRFTTKNSISNFESKLPPDNFIRVHKSYIVSIPKIKSFTSTTIELENMEIPISRTYKNAVMNALNYGSDL